MPSVEKDTYHYVLYNKEGKIIKIVNRKEYESLSEHLG